MKMLKKIEPFALVSIWAFNIYSITFIVPWWITLIGIIICVPVSAYILWRIENWDD